jgi:hypothetical protein
VVALSYAASFAFLPDQFVYREHGNQFDPARGVPDVGRLSCCAFVFVDEAAEDVAAVELPHCG